MNFRFFSIIFFTIQIITYTDSEAQAQKFAFRNDSLPIEERVFNLLKQLTVSEKITLLGYTSKPVERLGIPAYNWWNEALHGVARAGNATIFPQAIGMAASFNDALMYECASAISTEARAKYNFGRKKGSHLQYMGLSFWSPNINIFRDPRWGRGQETYGEDPYLTAAMGMAFVKGIQGTDKSHLKAAACAKHFAVHSGPESERHRFNAMVDEKDLRETYLYAFKKLVDTKVEAVMCAYNRVNDEPCCTGRTLLTDILQREWHFNGHIVTDCYALQDIYTSHKTLPNSVEVAAAAIKAGVNLDCSNLLQDDLKNALEQKLVKESEVDSALAPLLRTGFKLGFFDVDGLPEYANYGADSIANDYHRFLARKMAQQSMVLLKNDGNLLPLDKQKYPAIMIVGPNAASLDPLVGSYHGVSEKAVNFVEGITEAVGPFARIEYDMGCDFNDTLRFGGIWAAGNANLTIAVIGLTPVYEGEEGDAFLAEGGADRKSLNIPAAHIAYLRALRKGTKTPIIAVITAGSAVDVSKIAEYADAIILAWYPGEQGGNALADIIFGAVTPSGRLPVTFYHSFKDLPPYDDYSMKGRTYRYYDGQVEYPFGFGLSYTNFEYEWNRKPAITKDSISFSIRVRNSGNYDGDEVVQVYVQYPPAVRMPIKELKAFKRIFIAKGKSETIEFGIPLGELKKWDLPGSQWKLFPGNYFLVAGGHSNDKKISEMISLSSNLK